MNQDPRFVGAWAAVTPYLVKAKEESKKHTEDGGGVNVIHLYHIVSKKTKQIELNADHYYYAKNSTYWQKLAELQDFRETVAQYDPKKHIVVSLWIPKLANAPKDVIGSSKLLPLNEE